MVIWIAEQWYHHEKIEELRAKGHHIQSVEMIAPPDLILHPNAWRWDDGKWDFLDVALKEARKGQPKRPAAGKAGSKPRSRKGLKGSASE